MLLRHGETTFNAARVFTGLLDAPLAPTGEAQVEVAADLLRAEGLVPDLVWRSTMLRASRTTELLLGHLGIDLEVRSTWRLVERAYGCLTNVSKHDARERFGEEAFFTWRRTVHGRPPSASDAQRASWVDPPPVADSGPLVAGVGESLADVIARVLPVWTEELLPRLRAGGTVLVASHGNTLRALVTDMLGLSDAEAEQLNIPAGHPWVFSVGPDGAVAPGRYLDADAAALAEAAVAAEGGT